MRRALAKAMRLGIAAITAASAVAVIAPPDVAHAATATFANNGVWTHGWYDGARNDGGNILLNSYALDGLGFFTINVDGGQRIAGCIESSQGHQAGATYDEADVINSPQINYLLWKYTRPGVNPTNEQAVAAAALIWYYTGGDMSDFPGIDVWSVNGDPISPVSPWAWNALPQYGYGAGQAPVGLRFDLFTNQDGVEALVHAMYLDAEAKAGAWTIDFVAWDAGDAVFVVNGPNGPIVGETVSYTTDSGAVLTGVTNSIGRVRFTTAEAGTAEVEYPGATREFTDPNSQDLAIAGASLLAQAEAIPVAGTISATTQISDQAAVSGETISDSLIVTNDNPDDTDTTGIFDLQLIDAGPNGTFDTGPASNTVQGDDVMLVGTTTVGPYGPGTYDGLAPYTVTVAESGRTLGYRHRLVSSTSGQSTFPWSPLGIVAETSIVPGSNPSVVTQINNQAAIAGQTISDTFTVSGLAGESLANVELRLWDVTANESVQTWTVNNRANGTTSGHGSYTVPISRAGHTLVYQERIVFVGRNGVADPSVTVPTAWSGLDVASETTDVDISDPEVVTQINDQAAVSGATISDTITVSGLVGPALADIELQLVDVTDGDAVLGTWVIEDVANGTTSGHGEYVIPVERAGHTLVYRERVIFTGVDGEGEGDADGVTTDWSGLDVVSETTTVPFSEVTVETQVSDQITFAGETVSDTFTVSGLEGVATADIELQLVDVTAGDEVLGTWIVEDMVNGTTSGHGEYVVPMDREGHTLVYRERVIFTGVGDVAEGNADGTTPEGAPTDWSGLDVVSETTNVPRQPIVFTNTSTQVADLGDVVSDTFTVADARDDESFVIEVRLFDLTEDPTCASEPLVTATFYAAGNGTVSNIGRYVIRADEAGHQFGYIERIVSSSEERRSPDGEWEWSECGASSESLIVREDLDISTQVQKQQVTLNDAGEAKLVDIATVTGLTPEITYEVAGYDAETGEEVVTTETIPAETATVNVALYGPFNSIAEVECAEGTLAGEASYQIAANGDSKSPAITVTKPGVYTFVESVVSNDDADRSASHECGLRSETTLVLDQPSVTTQASTNTIWFGLGETVELADSYEINGMGYDINGNPQKWESTLVLYGPFDSPEAVECTKDNEVTRLVTTDAGDGLFISDPIAVPEAGYYTFKESVKRLADGATASHECGLAEESVMIYDAPTITTNARETLQPIDENAADGLLIDEVTLTGLVSEAGPYVVTVDWFGPYPKDLPATWLCQAGEAAGSVELVVEADGTFDMPALQVQKGGVYIAVARVTDANGTVVASHGCNEPNEIVTSQAFRKVVVIQTGGTEHGWALPAGLALAALAGFGLVLADQRRRRQATVQA